MRAAIETSPASVLPVEPYLSGLAPEPTLLPGESQERYRFIRGTILSDLSPRSAVEWLLAVDVVELSWEIERYRVLRLKILEHYREKAVEEHLSRIDLVEIAPAIAQEARQKLRRNAFEWRTSAEHRTEIEARLAAHGISDEAINAESIVQAREAFLLFQALIDTAQARRAALLRDIRHQRVARR